MATTFDQVELTGAASEPQRHYRHYAAIAAAVLVCGLLDFASGYEVSVFLIYGLPIAYAQRFHGTRVGMVTALACAVTWSVADMASGHRYSQEWILLVNGLHRLVFFMMVCLAVRHTSTHPDPHARSLRRCTQCQKVKTPHGVWLAPDESAAAHMANDAARTTVCPDCARRAYARAGYRN